MIRFSLDKTRKRTVSQQIVQQIIYAIETGELKKGDTLPAERVLAQHLEVTRGTVNKAYAVLKEKNYIVSRVGSHHYVTGMDTQEEVHKKKGYEYIEAFLNSMREMSFSNNEIRAMLNVALLEKGKDNNHIKLGVIECRPDALFIFTRQLQHIHDMDIALYLVDDILGMPSVVDEANTCDLLLTTDSHYYEVCKNVPVLEPKLIEVVTAWSEKTIFELAAIPSNARIGIVYSSTVVIDLVQSALQFFNIRYASLSAFNERNLRTFDDFCAAHTVLIAEPPSVIFQEDRRDELLKNFYARGGKTICFDHYIDKGSLLIVEQAIVKAINRRLQRDQEKSEALPAH